MTRALIQAEIVTILKTVTDIGSVHNGVRWAVYEDKFIQDFFSVINDEKQIRTWMITRVEGGVDYGARNGSLGSGIPITTQGGLERYDFTMEGWASFKDDDTDTEFQALIDSVIDAFEAKVSLNSTANMRGPIQYSIDHQFFGDYFVHHVIFSFYAIEVKNLSIT